MSWRDVVHCLLAALAMTLVVCGIPYLAAGGPVPGMASAAVVTPPKVAAPLITVKMDAPSASSRKVAKIATSAWPKAYQVIPDDYLSKIAQKIYGNPADWTVIYWANHYQVPYANEINVGQNLTIPALPAVIPAGPRVLAPPPPPQTYHPASSVQTVARTTSAAPVSYAGAGGFQSCVIRAESGGNPFAQNPVSSASGLYGFLDSTWYAITGLSGHARDYSVAEQNAAFWKEYALDGTAPWAPYDGC